MTFILLFSNDEKREQFKENVEILFWKKIDEMIYTRKTAILVIAEKAIWRESGFERVQNPWLPYTTLVLLPTDFGI